MDTETTTRAAEVSKTLWMALELSLSKWKIAFGDGGAGRARLVTIEARDFEALARQIERAKRALKLPNDTKVQSLYEAGRDGFAVQRKLVAMGIHNVVVDPASLEVSRQARRAKSDGIDAESLLRHLIGLHRGHGKLSVVRVPSPEDESHRHLDRELETLKQELGQHRKRIQSLLFAQGVHAVVSDKLLDHLASLRTLDGRELGHELLERIRREFARLELVQQQVKELEKQRKDYVSQENPQSTMIQRLCALMGIGSIGSFRLVVECFGWRTFSNRRELSQAAGLAPSPFASGQMDREQGISKVGNKRVRALMLEFAWCWLRYQPQSDLSRWFNERFGSGRRSRRIGVVAVARRLLVALWRYLTFGEVPKGASLKAKAATAQA